MTGYPGEGDDRPQDYDSGYTRPLGWQSQPPERGPADQYQRQQGGWGSSPYESVPPPPTGRYPLPPGPFAHYPAPEHPQALSAMLVGILALVIGLSTCGLGLIASPVAWFLGRQSLQGIRDSGGHYGGESKARAGQVTGIIGTVLLVLGLVALLGLFAQVVLVDGGSSGLDGGNV